MSKLTLEFPHMDIYKSDLKMFEQLLRVRLGLVENEIVNLVWMVKPSLPQSLMTNDDFYKFWELAVVDDRHCICLTLYILNSNFGDDEFLNVEPPPVTTIHETPTKEKPKPPRRSPRFQDSSKMQSSHQQGGPSRKLCFVDLLNEVESQGGGNSTITAQGSSQPRSIAHNETQGSTVDNDGNESEDEDIVVAVKVLKFVKLTLRYGAEVEDKNDGGPEVVIDKGSGKPVWHKRYLPDMNNIGEEVDPNLFPEEDEIPVVDPGKMLVKCAFQNKQLFKKHLKRYCVKENKQFKCKKSCLQQVRAQCRFKDRDDCKWFVYAIRVEGESTIFIRSVNLEHTCVGDPKSFNRSADPDLVKDVVLEKLKHSSGSFIPKPRNIAEDFSMLHNIKIPYICAWKAWNLVLEEMFGDYEESYAEVPKFCSMVADTNPGSVAKFTYGRKEYDNLFSVPMKGFQDACRGVVGFDACHLTGKWGGVLMAATSLDGENRLVSLEKWLLFMRDIAPGILAHHSGRVTFISDQQKGLLKAVAEVFPGFPHRYCWR
ncbi:hypothetical protein MKW92_026328 [Papaver armeniacum]|nr:hypothetical protein MKW92_026328 [Papaver armeniacum]